MTVDHSGSMSANDTLEPPRRRGVFRSFARSRKGVAAIEFGMVAIPFLGLLCAIFETAFVFFVQTAFDSGVITTTRAIQTNQYSTTNPPTTVKDFMAATPSGGATFCSNLPSFISCSFVYLNVQSFGPGTAWTTINAALSNTFYKPNFSSTYNATTATLPVTLPSNGLCNPSGAVPQVTSCIVIFQAFYAMPIYLSVLVANSTNSATNFYNNNNPVNNVIPNASATGFVHTIFSTSAFRTEP